MEGWWVGWRLGLHPDERVAPADLSKKSRQISDHRAQLRLLHRIGGLVQLEPPGASLVLLRPEGRLLLNFERKRLHLAAHRGRADEQLRIVVEADRPLADPSDHAAFLHRLICRR